MLGESIKIPGEILAPATSGIALNFSLCLPVKGGRISPPPQTPDTRKYIESDTTEHAAQYSVLIKLCQRSVQLA